MLNLASGMSRLGTESAFEVLARAKALEAKGKHIINLGIGQPDFQTPAHIVEAACKALRDGHHGYTPANGIPQVREAVAANLHKRHGVGVDPGHVVVVPGGKVTMFFAMLMFGVNLLWPPGVYQPETPLLDLPSDRITIVGREAVKLTGTQALIYRPWS